MNHLRVVYDDDLGAVAEIIDDDGNVLASASAGVTDGVYMAVDEAQLLKYGHLLPPPE